MEDHLPNLAKHFLVFKATISHPDTKCSIVVARQSCTSIDSLRLKQTFDSVINNLTLHDVGVATVCGDGATKNVSFYESSSTVKLNDFLTNGTKSLFEKYSLQKYLIFEIAMKDWYIGDLIFFLKDIPHVLKRLVNALSNSSNDNESRNLHHGSLCMNILMIQQIWEVTGGLTAVLHPTKLTGGHFDKDNFSKMRVYLFAQVVSSSVARMITLACEDDAIDLHFN